MKTEGKKTVRREEKTEGKEGRKDGEELSKK